MELTFAPKNILEINDARIIFRNFRGEGSMYNDEGNRNFAVVIPNEEIKDALINDTNQYGVGWNVRIKPPRMDGEEPYMYLTVKVKYSDRSKPKAYLITNGRKKELTEETIHILDDIDIRSVDLDIRAYDGESKFGPFRAAYLQAIYVVQEVDRFKARFAEEEGPEE